MLSDIGNQTIKSPAINSFNNNKPISETYIASKSPAINSYNNNKTKFMIDNSRNNSI